MAAYRYILAVLVALFPLCPGALAMDAATGERALAVVGRMEAAYANVNDYTATFLKQEYVDEELLPRETIIYKFKKPFKVYMGWREGPHEGREALYVKGRYDDEVVGHEGGWLSIVTLQMDPRGSVAMSGNRHPITESGIGMLIEIVSRNVRRAVANGELSLTAPVHKKAFGRDADYYVAKLPEDKGYYGAKFELWVDSVYGLPVKIKMYDHTGRMIESYGYRDIKLNPGLPDEVFDRDYEGYDF